MTMTAEHPATAAQAAQRKYKAVKAPALRAVPKLADERPAVDTAAPKMPKQAPTAVELARSTSDADAQAALAKLRELVVGPTQQLNEARLEELVKIFEERETEMRAMLRDVQKRNSELEVVMKQTFLEQLNSFKSEFLALTDSMASESKKMCASIREDIAASRKDALDLVHDANAATEQKFLVHAARLEGLLKSEAAKLQTDIKLMDSNLKAAQTAAQTETHNCISRALKDAADNLARTVAAE